jgi:CheY-like chemotaxis protein
MSKRILVIIGRSQHIADDLAIVRLVLDHEITEVENGEEALAAIAKQRPDLILMDIQLPIMDGYRPIGGLLSCDRQRFSTGFF